MKAVVTGGGGFLGGALVRALVAEGHEVRSLSRGRYPELEALGVDCRRVDLSEPAAVNSGVEGADCVFHAAALTGIWGPRAAFFRTNLDGTRNVLDACFRHRVPRLVYTSSPSVCFDGDDHVRAGNDLPYASRWLADYPESKAAAEREVLSANGSELATCSLRPHLIFGPGDPHLVPRLVERARAGKLMIVGEGRNEVTLCYVDNAVHAHLAAAERLATDGARAGCAGRAYFIGQEEPVLLWDWVRDLLDRVGVEPPRRRITERTARRIGGAMELCWRGLRLKGEPRMTRFLAGQLARSHSYDMAPARRDLGYREQVPLAEATERVVAWLRELGPAGVRSHARA